MTPTEDTMYHVTGRKNLETIFTEGILPGKRRGLTWAKCDKVFLTNDPGRIIRTQAGRKWTENQDLVVIEIKPGLTVKPHEYDSGATYTLSDFEFTTEKVPVEFLGEVIHWSNFCKFD